MYRDRPRHYWRPRSLVRCGRSFSDRIARLRSLRPADLPTSRNLGKIARSRRQKFVDREMRFQVRLQSINPANGDTLDTVAELTSEQIEEKLARAAAAFGSWRRTSFTERHTIMRRAAEILVSEKQKWAELITLEMGKTLVSAVGEVEKCALACRYYADHA